MPQINNENHTHTQPTKIEQLIENSDFEKKLAKDTVREIQVKISFLAHDIKSMSVGIL